MSEQLSSPPRSLAERISAELLPHVSRPAQYIGREINQLVHDGDWERAEVRLVLAFPDVYEIGMSHLGCQILYWLANHTPGVCAERCYLPSLDAAEIMRQRSLPLFTWDTRQPAASADLFAVSLQYEMAFTGLLMLLDLAGLPLRAAERDDRHPLVLVGGPQADNPEPVAEFVDLAVIGDGEDSLAAILAAYKKLKAGGMRRRDMIAVLARQFPWSYAPNQYRVAYGCDRTIDTLAPPAAGIPVSIARCRTRDFENAPFPLRPLIPHIQTVHDRIAIEIMRGCPQRCRFCHASFTKRPLTWRSPERILEIAEQQYQASGQSELGLLSLSTSDYPALPELAAKINERFAPRHVSISLPSLRVDRMLQDIPWMAASVRKSGLTIAVEAASERLRSAIRKKVTDGNLLEGLAAAYSAGWRRVKCYFMVGFPGETPADIRAIYDLCVEMALTRARLGKGPANIHAGVSWLVPKPHTPFQWAAQPRAEYFEEARRILDECGRSRRVRAVQVKTHDISRSILEGILARGDRRLAPVIERAYRLGACYDGWDEHFRIDRWRQAFEETGIDPDWYAHRERASTEILPWDHIRSGPAKDHLRRDYEDVFVRLEQAVPRPGSVA